MPIACVQMSLRSVPLSLNGSLTTSHTATRPLYRPTSVAMCCFMIEVRVAALKLPPVSQPGSCECQTRLWPRMRWLCDWAKLTIWSAPDQLNWPRVGSTTPHFISFSGVTELNWAAPMLAYVASADRWLAASAVPILTPRASASDRSVGPAASAAWTPSTARHSAATTGTRRHAPARARRKSTAPCVMVLSPSLPEGHEISGFVPETSAHARPVGGRGQVRDAGTGRVGSFDRWLTGSRDRHAHPAQDRGHRREHQQDGDPGDHRVLTAPGVVHDRARHHDHQAARGQGGEARQNPRHRRQDEADRGQDLGDTDEHAEPVRDRGRPPALLAHAADHRLGRE